MTITYHGHSCFKLKGKVGVAVTDPYDSHVGFSMPNMTADIVTLSHDHKDHNQANKVKASSRRKKPFVVKELGEYEVGGISVFGVKSYHDATQGEERGSNYIFTTQIDGLRVCHLGDLGHEVSEQMVKEIGQIDVLLLPVGGTFTIDAKQAVAAARALEPSIVIPMHYKTPQHDEKIFGELQTAEDFIKEFGAEGVVPAEKLDITKERLPEEMELVVLTPLVG